MERGILVFEGRRVWIGGRTDVMEFIGNGIFDFGERRGLKLEKR